MVAMSRFCRQTRIWRRFVPIARTESSCPTGLATRQPGVVAALLEEMVARGALDQALGGRDDVSLEPLMAFLIKYVSKPRYSKLLVRVCERILALYAKVLGTSPVIDDLIYRLNHKVKEEVQLLASQHAKLQRQCDARAQQAADELLDVRLAPEPPPPPPPLLPPLSREAHR